MSSVDDTPLGRVHDSGLSLADLVRPLAENAKWLVAGPLIAGSIALGLTYLIPPTFTARTTILPPQQAQSAMASALASLGSLAGLAGGAAGGVRSPAEQYVALMQSTTVLDRIVEQFKLLEVYDAEYRVDARRMLADNLRISVGKKDGLISIEVDDHSPQRAADLANRFVAELRRITTNLAVSEAQQRRLFFEQQLKQSHDRLTEAQTALQSSGFNPGALKVEPKAAADGYARLKAEATAAEVRLQVMRGSLNDRAPEVVRQQATVAALREQLAKAEQPQGRSNGPDYISRYREFKYQEALFDLYARQFELARVDESREGMLIQVVDPASPPERKSKPQRAFIAVNVTIAVALLWSAVLLLRTYRRDVRR